MTSTFPSIIRFNEHCILIDFGREIQENLLNEILSAQAKIQKNDIELKLEVISTYTSLLVYYLSGIRNFYDEKQRLKELLNETNSGDLPDAGEFDFPVCYDPAVAPDLKLISHEKKKDIDEIIELHSASTYRVYMVGFLPGFIYLGGLDKQLEMPRKNEPRIKIEPGSVGIAGMQTGIYPRASPGGWQIIGRCPLSLFNSHQDPPMHIKQGDTVRFYSVSIQEYEKLKAAKPDPLMFKA